MKRAVRSKPPVPADTITAVTDGDRIIAALRRIDSKTDAELIKRHARLIHKRMIDTVVSQRFGRGRDIGCDADGTAYARPRSKTKGSYRELRDLVRLCRKVIAGKIDLEVWAMGWAALPPRITDLWKPKLVKTPKGRTIDHSTVAMTFIASGFVQLIPKPEIVLPMIEAAFKEIDKAERSKKRGPNEFETKATEVIRVAYREITGHKGGRVILRSKLAGKLAALGREIDGIFGTALFDVKDSKRFRRKVSDTTGH